MGLGFRVRGLGFRSRFYRAGKNYFLQWAPVSCGGHQDSVRLGRFGF